MPQDMGLGKTVQTLARIVEGVPTKAELKAGYTGGTLIVAPLAVMEQWATEVRSKTLPGELRVTTHHGPSRAKSAFRLLIPTRTYAERAAVTARLLIPSRQSSGKVRRRHHYLSNNGVRVAG